MIEKKNGYHVIETPSDLQAFARSVQGEPILAVDLEADSMYHFREKVCLIQMASRQVNVLIDPLKVSDLSCLMPVFSDPATQKVFHGSDYDIRSLHRDFGIEIRNLFDTQLACRFLGIGETGLEAVLHRYFDISLDKKYQKKDWSKRPLPPEMMDYAAQDAVYLIPLAEKLQKTLTEKNRMAWVREDCFHLSKVRAISCNDEPLYLRFKGAGRLRSRNLAVLEALLQIRRKIAEKKDRPLFKILGNNSIMKIVESRPLTLRRLEKARALSPKQMNMYGPSVIKAVQQAMEIPKADLPVYPRKKGPVLSPRVPERVKALKLWRDSRAEGLEMDPALICNKALMTSLAVRNPRAAESLTEIEDMKQWQQSVFGEEIINVLAQHRRRKKQ